MKQKLLTELMSVPEEWRAGCLGEVLVIDPGKRWFWLVNRMKIKIQSQQKNFPPCFIQLTLSRSPASAQNKL